MRIAVTDTGKEEKQKLYLKWLRSFEPAAEFVVVSHSAPGMEHAEFDGLVLTGGEDVDPKYSKAEPVEKVEKTNVQRDQFEFAILSSAFKKNIPVLCICRGLQVANVHLGGTLIADLKHDGFQQHHPTENDVILRHPVSVREKTLMHEITGTNAGVINSYHHQAVKQTAESLIPSVFSKDGVIEALEWKEKAGRSYFLAVQWHPERMKDPGNPFTAKIGRSFFEAVRQQVVVPS